MKEFFVESIMRECAQPGSELVQHLAHASLADGVVLLDNHKQPVSKTWINRTLEAREWGSWRYHPTTNKLTVLWFSFSARIAPFDDIITSWSFKLFDKPRWNNFRVGGLLDVEFKDQRHLIDPYAQRIKELSRVLYPIARPLLGWVDNSNFSDTDVKDIKKLRLSTISWVNFFSPAYVHQYGEPFLLGLPGYQVKRLPDGGIFHQLSPSLVTTDEYAAQKVRTNVVRYCSEHGIEVTCHAPYYIPDLGVPAEQPLTMMDDAELKDYLAQTLSTSLALVDGTRIKAIYIPWAKLMPRQRTTVLHAIQHAAIEESKQHPQARVRFEFNDIPGDLEQMLRELVQHNQLALEWTQVMM